MSSPIGAQGSLFELGPHELEAAAVKPEHGAIAAELPRSIGLGAMTWTYAGWKGIVYGERVADKQLAHYGLTAYAKHPLLRSVELDRTYYEPLSVAELRSFRAQVPDDFRFWVKAHQDCCVLRFPEHARYGKRRGQDNPRFLDAVYAEQAVVEPLMEGLGDKLGGVLFQFPAQDAGAPHAFAQRIYDFVRRLPPGPVYAFELRNPELLTREYGQALEAAGAIHCHNAWTSMPPILTQLKRIPPGARRPLLIRWLLRPNERFEDARARYAPFDRIQAEDPDTRRTIAGIVAKAHQHGVPAFVVVDNKAEGCSPESIFRLAGEIVQALAAG